MKSSFVVAIVALLALVALSEDSPFAHKNIVVVGGTGSIGYATALALAKVGASVTLVSRNQHPYRPKGEEAAAAINNDTEVVAAGGHAEFRQADARDDSALTAVFEEIGDLHIVINAAGSLGFLGNLSNCKEYLNDEEHNPLLNYLKATIVSTATAGDFMVENNISGVIVNVGAYSEGAKIGYNYFSPFFMAASRGVEAATYAAAAKYVLKGVRVNGISLGIVDSPFVRNMAKFFVPNEKRQQPWEGEDVKETDEIWKQYKDVVIHREIPAGAPARIQDIVDGIFFLADPETDFISGTLLRADGGYWATASAL